MKSIQSKSGKSFIVRSVQIEDIEILLDYINELGKEDTFITANPQELETVESETKYVNDCVRKVMNNQMIKYLVFDQDHLIGLGDVVMLPKRQKHIGRLGITIRKSHRGQGLGKEVIKLLINDSKAKLGIKQVILSSFANNQIGINLYSNLGFIKYGQLKQGILYKGEYIDEIHMQKILN